MEAPPRKSSDFLERKKDLIAKTNQLINGHRNAQANGRSISLGSSSLLKKSSSKEMSPSIVEIPPSPVMKLLPGSDNISCGGGSDDNSKLNFPQIYTYLSSIQTLIGHPALNRNIDFSALVSNSMHSPANGEGRCFVAMPFGPNSSEMLSSNSSSIDEAATASAVCSAAVNSCLTTTSKSSFEETTSRATTRLTSSSLASASGSQILQEQMSSSTQRGLDIISGVGLEPATPLNCNGTSASSSVHHHQNEVHHLSSSSSCKDSVSSFPGGRGGNLITKESTMTSHTTKKSSLTMRTRLTKRPSLLSGEFESMLGLNSTCMMPLEEVEKGLITFEDLERIAPDSDMKMVESILLKYCSYIGSAVQAMKKYDKKQDLVNWLSKLNNMMSKSWDVPAFGQEMSDVLSGILRKNGGLELIIDQCNQVENEEVAFISTKLIHQCILASSESRGYLVEKALEKIVGVAKRYIDEAKSFEHKRVGTGILEYLFRHSEETCSEVISLGALDTIVKECQRLSTGPGGLQTLRQCSSALANVAMYGGSENQEAMIQRKVQSWLFPLAFHNDDTIKYYACLAIAVLVANKEMEAAVQKSKALDLIDPLVQSHTPQDFANTSAKLSYGQSRNWLIRLIPVLLSHRDEARNIAAFHFCMEAGIKKQSNSENMLKEIGCVEPLKKLASGPNGIAAKYAAQTLRLLAEEIPHKLSQQVPTWSTEDVKEWVKQIGFTEFADSFELSRVDGDLLLQLTEEMLRDDIVMKNGILRRRFLRELTHLKRMTDYASSDPTNLNKFLYSLGPEFSVYTYEMLKSGIDQDTLFSINEEQLLIECGIANKIHRLKILQGIKMERGEISFSPEDCHSLDKNLDVFISYRRSNGSQLASLLKVHLEIRNLSVFLDVDRLEAGKFDNNLLQSIRSAKNFVLVLTPGALDRCMGDQDQRDWIHKEVHCALNSNCNIIPVFDNFVMPDPDSLPETMKNIVTYNGVKWIHDYQDACVDKVERFIRGDHSVSSNYSMMDRFLSGTGSQTSSVASYNRSNTYQRTMSNDSTKPPSATGSSSDDPIPPNANGNLEKE